MRIIQVTSSCEATIMAYDAEDADGVVICLLTKASGGGAVFPVWAPRDAVRGERGVCGHVSGRDGGGAGGQGPCAARDRKRVVSWVPGVAVPR
jgi:hypothetical protein